MKIIDAYILARTKRKTRRIRTALVVVVSSLLFSVLFFGAFVVQGIIDTGQQVKDAGFNGRNMVNINPAGPPSFDYMQENQKIEDTMTAELKARGIKVTDQTKLDPSWMMEFSRRFNARMGELSVHEAARLEETIKSLGAPTALYHFKNLDFGFAAKYQSDLAVDPLAEELRKQEVTGMDPAANKGQGPGYEEPLYFYSAEQDMLRTQLQPGFDFAWQPGQPYPLVISYAYLEKLAGQSFSKVGAAEKNKAYRELMKTYSGKELTYCYRNQTAQTQLRSVVHYNYTAEHDKDANTKSIDVPNCGGFDQKLLKKLELISAAAPTDPKPLFPQPADPAPVTQQVKLRIVGFVPSTPEFADTNVINQILTNVSMLPAPTKLGIIPTEVVNADPLLQTKDPLSTGPAALFADFATRQEQKAFIDKGCIGTECSAEGNTKPYIIAFGSTSLALEGFISNISKFMLLGMAAVMIIAALMIMFTISKVISDSTKEIAVFRSLGARRRDIAQIYYTYGSMLTAASLVLALILAVIGGMIATSIYKDRVANTFVQTLGAYNTDVHATLLGINPVWICGIALAMVVAAFVGISVPIIASLRRKLITILREE